MAVRFGISPRPGAAELERGRLLFSDSVEFLAGAVAPGGFPPPDRTEVCLAGRSNVGKSSLINALTFRKSLARISRTPGRTREINFFSLGSRHYLVDVPGYGYAKAPRHMVRAWQALLGSYLAGRPSLRRVFLLVDARHGPKPVDIEVMDLLDRAAVTFQVVLTKADKAGTRLVEDTAKATARELARHPAAFPEFLPTSAATGEGVDALRGVIASLE